MNKEAFRLLMHMLQMLWPLLAIIWGAGLLFQVLMIRHRKPEVKLFDRRLMYNPFNAQFYGSEYLTLDGLKWRNLSWICYGVFAAILVVIFGIYYYMK
jgi:hypothetical protein